HCAYDNCISELANHCGGSFCALHEQQYGTKCHVCNCNDRKVQNTKACARHKREWDKHVQNLTCQSFNGARRML
ncbi:hypothetical protein L208DRAFT_1072078, partial [Tricholoma matsutake]